ncbi:MAG: Uma2 family endonuclease [Moorea sp. SIO4G2]|nr:Uma2 family endonuclease [Moorena sp. SIO4G2]
MIANPQRYRMTPEEYLEWEPTQEIRYEYSDGEVFAMTGGSKPHNRIALNLASDLNTYLQDSSCEVYMVDVKVKISSVRSYHYPHVVVTCDSRDQESNQFIQYPCLIVEVLSPSTEAYDRGSKFAKYRKLKTLQEYVLIQSETIGVECFRRNQQGFWVLYPYEKGDTFLDAVAHGGNPQDRAASLTLESVNFSVSLEALYRGVRFDYKS